MTSRTKIGARYDLNDVLLLRNLSVRESLFTMIVPLFKNLRFVTVKISLSNFKVTLPFWEISFTCGFGGTFIEVLLSAFWDYFKKFKIDYFQSKIF
jgi:hypothetical protein